MAPPSIEQGNAVGNGYVSGSAHDGSKTLRQLQRAEGPATILAIGTANPKTLYKQSEFPDFYFNITNSNHETELKQKMTRICEKSGIKQRYLYLTEEMLRKTPEICSYSDNSMNARQALGVGATPKLGAEAAERALEEWGRPRSLITHVVFASSCGIHMPGADYTMSVILGLRPDVKRIMLYHQGCFAGANVLRVAKDLAENNRGARVLAVDSEITIETFRGPVHDHPSLLVGSAIFSDGAGAMIIGSDPLPNMEKPIFEVHASLETFLPNTLSDIQVGLSQAGLHYFLSKDLPKVVAKNTPAIFKQALELAGSPDHNDIFWCVHPGGRAILDEVEKLYALRPEKLEATRDSLRNYGNMFGASVFFVLDRLRKKAKEENLSTTGDGCEWGLLMGMGPGIVTRGTACGKISDATIAKQSYDNMSVRVVVAIAGLVSGQLSGNIRYNDSVHQGEEYGFGYNYANLQFLLQRQSERKVTELLTALQGVK